MDCETCGEPVHLREIEKGNSEIVEVEDRCPSEPVDSYENHNGKTVSTYTIQADSLRGALDKIPGDFTLYWYNQDRGTFYIEIVRTF